MGHGLLSMPVLEVDRSLALNLLTALEMRSKTVTQMTNVHKIKRNQFLRKITVIPETETREKRFLPWFFRTIHCHVKNILCIIGRINAL